VNRIALVLITSTAAGVRYTRYLGRRLTHRLEAQAGDPLSWHELQLLRALPRRFLSQYA
jgi:hypothetical protein